MVSHFLFEAEFCNPASGWEKGQVEKNVQDARHRLWRFLPRPMRGVVLKVSHWLLLGTELFLKQPSPPRGREEAS